MAKTGTSTVRQRAQFGFETTPGTRVPATWKPRSAKFTVSPNSEIKEIAASGELFVAASVETDRWVEGGASEGTPDYREFAYVLRFLAGRPVITSPSAGKTERVFTLDGAEIATTTAEFGDSDAAAFATGVFATGGSIEWSRNGRVSAYDLTLRGDHFEDGATLTPENTVTQVQLVPTSGQHVQVYIGNSVTEVKAANATAAVGILSAKINLGEQAGMVKYFSGIDFVSLFATSTLELVARKAEGTALINSLRGGAVRYVRVAATVGNFVLEFISAVTLSAEGAREDESGAYVVKPTLRLAKSADTAPTFRLVNDLASYAGEAYDGAAAGKLTADKPA